LDVLIAQRSLFDAELSLAATRRLHLVSVVQLYKALGGGWSPEKPREDAEAKTVKASG
jgi:multidrug efflux system outer membrane protein